MWPGNIPSSYWSAAQPAPEEHALHFFLSYRMDFCAAFLCYVSVLRFCSDKVLVCL